MASYKLTRRDLISGIMKGAFTIPFALSPMGRLAYGQTVPSRTPLRLITITVPFSPRTETTDGSNTDNNFIRIMWNQFSSEVREYTRFFSNFSYNIADNAWHGSAGFSHLLTCNSLAEYRGQFPADPSRYPRSVSMDYEIASLMSPYYTRYNNILNSTTMPMTLFSHSPYGDGNEYTGSEDFYYPPIRGDSNFDGDANFTCFLTYRPDGTVKNPLYPNTANAYSSIFGIQNNVGDPIPAVTSLDQVLELIHNTDITNYITQKQLQGTLESEDKILDLQRRISKHRTYLANQQNPPSGGECTTPSVTWPGVSASHNALNAYNFEAIKSLISCDLHRVINFSFTDSEGAGMENLNANALNNTNIDNHDSINLHLATHRQITSNDNGNDDNAYIESIYNYFYGQIGTLLSDLQEMPDPLAPGTNVLDNTIVYITGTTGFPDVHSANNMAIAVVGGGRRLESGVNLLPKFPISDDYRAHVFDGTDAYASSSVPSYNGHDKVANLQLSLLHLFGSTRTSWGTDGGRNNSDARSNGVSDLINFSAPGTSAQYRFKPS